MIRPGSKVGRFVVLSELGSGGMGAVYAAHDPQLDRQVALKVMRDASENEEDRVRMLREGQAMARVTHPNVITVYEVGTENGVVFLAQELLDAGTLASWLEKPHTHAEILDKMIAAGRGLAAAHAVGLVHRDFKPENVLLGKDGRIRVADFGLARSESMLAEALGVTHKSGGPLAVTNKGGGPPRNESDVTRSPMSPLTRTGAVMGTPMFMAPEQHLGERADARSDQFAFCVSLYQALYKQWPFEGKTAPALADAVISGRMSPPPKATAATVSPNLRKILLRGLATDPAARYPSMDALLADLEREARPAGTRTRTPFIIAGALAVVVAGAGATFLFLKSRKNETAAVPVAPLPALPADLMTPEKGIEWLSNAIDVGRFSEALDNFRLRAPANRTPTQVAIDSATVAYLHVLRGDLKEADAALAAANGALASAPKDAGTDPIADAYLDLAESALALTRGQLRDAREGSERCAKVPAPILAAICHQLHGEVEAALGDTKAARTAFSAGLDLVNAFPASAAKQKEERASTLRLALAQLDLDEYRVSLDAATIESAETTAKEIQTDCQERGAVGCNVQARILLARIRAAEPSKGDALEILTAGKPATIEAYPVRAAHEIALGEVLGYQETTHENDEAGADRIETVRNKAEQDGFKLLGLEARLARVRVLLALNQDAEAQSGIDDVKKLAGALNAKRFVRLAEAALKEFSEPARDMLPADGGLPTMRSGSSSEP
jgi:serine/threonine protein kinase